MAAPSGEPKEEPPCPRRDPQLRITSPHAHEALRNVICSAPHDCTPAAPAAPRGSGAARPGSGAPAGARRSGLKTALNAAADRRRAAASTGTARRAQSSLHPALGAGAMGEGAQNKDDVSSDLGC